jgi:hypothetical protein
MRGNRFLQAVEEDFPTCPGCKDQVFPRERPVRALDAQWHPNCLKCTTCKTLLNVRSLESYEKKPYCSAHRPSASATQVADDVHIKQATSVPKAADRAAGVDVTAQRKFAAPGRNVRLDAHADRAADRFTSDRSADTGEYTKEALPSATNAGISWADSTHKADTGEFVREAAASRTQAGHAWADPSHKSDQGEFGSTPAASASSAGATWADPTQRHDQGEYVKDAAARPAPSAPSSFASRAPPAAAPPRAAAPPPAVRAAAPPPAVRTPAPAPVAAPAMPPPSPMVAETYEESAGAYDEHQQQHGEYTEGGYDQQYQEGQYYEGGEAGYDQQYQEGGEAGYDQQYQEGQYYEGGEAGYDQQYQEGGEYQEGQYYEGGEGYYQEGGEYQEGQYQEGEYYEQQQ